MIIGAATKRCMATFSISRDDHYAGCHRHAARQATCASSSCMGAGPSAAGAAAAAAGGGSNDSQKSNHENHRAARAANNNERIRQQLIGITSATLQTLVEHYQPPSFPIAPVVSNKTVEICKNSWHVIKAQDRKGVSGTVYFYDAFYKRLFDRSEAFNGFFSGDMKKKGMVLIRIVEFLTTLDVENDQIFYKKLEGLAKVHSTRTIRPWMYSVFIETLMTTVSVCLEEKATVEVASAWTNLGAYVLRALLPGAIKETIVTTESNQNSYSTELDEDQINDIESQQGDGLYSARGSGRSARGFGRETSQLSRFSSGGSPKNSAR